MPRRTFDAIVSSVGLVLTGVLIVAGALLFWGHQFADGNVRDQLGAQKIFFPEKGDPGLADPRIAPHLTKYAGQQLVTGEQARAYADHYIAVHLQDTAGGKTYAEMGPLVRANPNDTELASQREALFKGEALRGVLLTAYGFWKVGQLALIGSIASFALAGIMVVLTILGFWHLRRVSPDEEILAPVGDRARVKTPA